MDSANLNATIFNSLRIIDNSIFTAGTAIAVLEDRVIRNSGILSKFDLEGNMLFNRYYIDTLAKLSYDFESDVIFEYKNNFFLSSQNFDYTIGLLKLEKNGVVLQRKVLSTGDSIGFVRPKKIAKFNNDYIFAVSLIRGVSNKVSICYLDSLLNLKKQFDIQDGERLNIPTQLIVNKNNNLTLSFIKSTYRATDTNYVYISQLREIDTAGNLIWKYETPRNKYIYIKKFVQLANGNYLVWGDEEIANFQLQGARWSRIVTDRFLYLAEINPQIGMFKEKRLSLGIANMHHSLKILKDSSIALGASYSEGFYNEPACLIKLNKNYDSLYRRNFRANQLTSDRVIHYPNQIEEMTNGDLVIGGYVWDLPVSSPTAGQWGWLVRTDALGCSLEPSSCRVATQEVENEPLSINVFPNPVSAQLTVDYAFTELPKDATLQITDILGRTVYRQKMVNKQGQIIVEMATLQTGLYLVNVYTEKHIIWQTKVAVQR